jgi:hypothetical protein
MSESKYPLIYKLDDNSNNIKLTNYIPNDFPFENEMKHSQTNIKMR